MSAELRIAVVGAGRMGSDHISRIRDRMKKARLTAVIDINEEAATQAIEGIEGAKVYTNFLEALDSDTVDAVLIATPGFLHEAVLIPAIERGLPILCEKPLTTDSGSAWRVVEAEVKAGKKLVQVGFNRRFDAGYQDIKTKLDTGEYGELLQLELTPRMTRQAARPSSTKSSGWGSIATCRPSRSMMGRSSSMER